MSFYAGIWPKFILLFVVIRYHVVPWENLSILILFLFMVVGDHNIARGNVCTFQCWQIPPHNLHNEGLPWVVITWCISLHYDKFPLFSQICIIIIYFLIIYKISLRGLSLQFLLKDFYFYFQFWSLLLLWLLISMLVHFPVDCKPFGTYASLLKKCTCLHSFILAFQLSWLEAIESPDSSELLICLFAWERQKSFL